MTDKLGKKEQTRLRMLDAASRSFRRNGYAGIGVDGIAKAAGVTSGAFYSHLGSKDAAFEEVLIMGLDEVIAGIPDFQREAGLDWVKAFCDYYLDLPHRTDFEKGCAMTSLTPEVVKSKPSLHKIYEAKMKKIATLFSKGLAGENSEARAWVTLSTLIGGLNIVRAMENDNMAGEIAITIKEAALSVAGETKLIDS